MRFISAVAAILALSSCAPKQQPKTAAAAPAAKSKSEPCLNPVLRVDNTTQETARIYSGNTIIAEVGPGSHTIALRNSSRGKNYRAVTGSPHSRGSVSVTADCDN